MRDLSHRRTEHLRYLKSYKAKLADVEHQLQDLTAIPLAYRTQRNADLRHLEHRLESLRTYVARASVNVAEIEARMLALPPSEDDLAAAQARGVEVDELPLAERVLWIDGRDAITVGGFKVRLW